MAGNQTSARALAVPVIMFLLVSGGTISSERLVSTMPMLASSDDLSVPVIPTPPALPGERNRQPRVVAGGRRTLLRNVTDGVRSVRHGFRLALRFTARDLTEPTGSRSALIIAPHPDDETLGCGGTILRKTAAGTPVNVLIVTDGSTSHADGAIPPDKLAALRREEMQECAARLGLAETAVRWAGLPDGGVAECRGDLTTTIAGLIKELEPDEIYVTGLRDPHPDHAAAGFAARTAVAETQSRATILEYPIWLWNSWPFTVGARLRSTLSALWMVVARRAVVVDTAEYTDAKLHALNAHASQIARPAGIPDDAEWEVLPAALLSEAAQPKELFLRG